MAQINKTRLDKAYEKKNASVASAKLVHTDIPGTDEYELFVLPSRSLITDAYIIKSEVSQAGVTANLGFDGGSELISNAALGTIANVKDALTVGVLTGTGKVVTFKPSAVLTKGTFQVVIEYVEFTRGNGEFTQFSTRKTTKP